MSEEQIDSLYVKLFVEKSLLVSCRPQLLVHTFKAFFDRAPTHCNHFLRYSSFHRNLRQYIDLFSDVSSFTDSSVSEDAVWDSVKSFLDSTPATKAPRRPMRVLVLGPTVVPLPTISILCFYSSTMILGQYLIHTRLFWWMLGCRKIHPMQIVVTQVRPCPRIDGWIAATTNSKKLWIEGWNLALYDVWDFGAGRDRVSYCVRATFAERLPG